MKQPLSFLIAILVGLILGSFFIRNFTRDFNRITSGARRISKGDLTDAEKLDSDSQTRLIKDEIGDLAQAVALMSERLKILVGQITANVSSLTDGQAEFASDVSR